MNFLKLRQELTDYYLNRSALNAEEFRIKAVSRLNETVSANASVYQQKVAQYEYISQNFEPILFDNSPFYYETGTLSGICDGARDFRGHSHAGGFTFWRNMHKFREFDEQLWQKKRNQTQELFYLICGEYNDTNQHFAFNHRPILQNGLKGIYDYADSQLKNCTNSTEIEFLQSVKQGLLCIKRMAEKFAFVAKQKLKTTKNKNFKRIAECAQKTPWNAPTTFYEALNLYAFMRKAIGSLEGIGVNSFGRLDIDLYPFYEKDLKSRKVTKDEVYDLISQFLITFDCHYDHDLKMVYYSDHEFENTYVLGGVDENGNSVYNDLTEMFLRATREEKIIYPKIKCRFGKNSKKEYLDEINRSTINGTSVVLYQNDDACIPALLRAGRTQSEAYDYIVTGCWGMSINGCEKCDDGGYVNLLKPFEYSIHNLTEKMEKVQMNFIPLDNAKTFEDVYSITLENMRTLIKERIDVVRRGGDVWSSVDVLPIFSSTLGDCIKKRRDVTCGGGKYRDDHLLFFGLPNIVDSLLAINELCFITKRFSLSELLSAVRQNWQGYETMRVLATRCSGWGDGSYASTQLANRFNNDLYAITSGMTGSYGGKVLIGHLAYTEIRWWGEKTLATPDGRKSGEYFAQGLTPSRLKKIPSSASVVASLSGLDRSTLAGNSVVNIILPADKITLNLAEAFLRSASCSAMQSLQLNCTTLNTLLDAQVNPQKYPDLIVRVTGFSAKFTSLSKEWQNEFITRNFYES